MEYTALKNSFPRKTVLFHFDFFYVPLTDGCLYCRKGILVSVMILIEQKTKYFDRNANSLLKLTFYCLLIKTKACYAFWSQVADSFCTCYSLGSNHSASLCELFPALKIKLMELISFMQCHIKRELFSILTKNLRKMVLKIIIIYLRL